jgi:hypothetical protein
MATLRNYHQRITELLSQDKSYEEIFNTRINISHIMLEIFEVL